MTLRKSLEHIYYNVWFLKFTINVSSESFFLFHYPTFQKDECFRKKVGFKKIHFLTFSIHKLIANCKLKNYKYVY